MLINYYYEDKDRYILLLYGDMISLSQYSLSYYCNVLSKYFNDLYIKSCILTIKKELENSHPYIEYTFDLSNCRKLSDLKYLFKTFRCISKTIKWIKKWGIT